MVLCPRAPRQSPQERRTGTRNRSAMVPELAGHGSYGNGNPAPAPTELQRGRPEAGTGAFRQTLSYRFTPKRETPGYPPGAPQEHETENRGRTATDMGRQAHAEDDQRIRRTGANGANRAGGPEPGTGDFRQCPNYRRF